MGDGEAGHGDGPSSAAAKTFCNVRRNISQGGTSASFGSLPDSPAVKEETQEVTLAYIYLLKVPCLVLSYCSSTLPCSPEYN
jgi:hypothetical protein